MLGLCLFVSQKCYAATIEINDCLGMGWEGMGIAPWESHGNRNWLQNWEWEWEGMGIDWMGMGENGNIKSHSRSSLVRNRAEF